MHTNKDLAIVGMEAAWAGCDGLDAFERMVYEMTACYAPLSTPPACESLLSKVARGALQDAGLNHASGMRVAALVACNPQMQVNWSWAVTVEDVSTQANPLPAALDAAQRLLTSGSADAVLFTAGSGLAELPADAPLAGEEVPAGLGFDREIHGWRMGQGAGAVVLMPLAAALIQGRRVYAVIRSVAVSAENVELPGGLPVAPALDDLRGCCRATFEAAGISPEQVGYVEAFACGSDALDAIEIAGLAQSYRLPEQDLTTALGSAQANTGYLGAAAGLAGLIRVALCLYHREIPGTPGWSAPKLPALWRGSPFYVPGESRVWFQKSNGEGRLAGLNIIGLKGSAAHLILGEVVEQPVRPNRALVEGGFYLFPLAGDSLDELTTEMEDLRQGLMFSTDLNHLAAEYYAIDSDHAGARYALAIVGHDHDEVLREIEYALKAVPTAFEKNSEWQTPVGSYFTPDPAGLQGGVALVYPGAFNSYPGVGKDLFRLVPGLHQRAAEITADMGRVIRERLLYPRSLTAISKDELAALEAKLLADPIAMLISGTTLAILYTYLLQDTFKIRPAAAFGYSLGENSMMYATGVWGQGDQASARLEESVAFRERLAGPQQAIRDFWGLPAANGSGYQPLWSNYLVMAAPEKVQAALEKEPRVCLTHINTPRQVVIGGDPQGCQRVLSELRASSIQAPFDYALHCEVMRSEYDALAELHDWPVERTPDLRMYTAADYEPLPLEQREVTQKIAHMLTSPLDFPRLVRRVYEDGARVFIEAGAGGNCARWVSESLKGSSHLALSMNRRGTDDYSTLVRTLARLYSHRVPMDLTALYRPITVKVY